MAFDSLSDGYLLSSGLADCFDAETTLAHMLRFEVALAEAEAEAGIIPAAAAAAITAGADDCDIDLDALKRATAQAGNPAIPFVTLFTAHIAGRDIDAARYVHWGSTSQDVMDSATMLSCAAGLDLIDARLLTIGDLLVALIEGHRLTPMVARTLSQHAGPTTFGYKAASWLNGLLAGQHRLRVLRARLPLQFGGASGTLASFGERGRDVAVAVAHKLGLTAVMPWHTERGFIRELSATLAECTATCGKIAGDALLMMQTEVSELREAPAADRGGSSALPHKRNPVATIAVIAGARRVAGLLSTIFAGFDHSHERAAGAWHSEAATLREMFVVGGSVFEQLDNALDGIEVDVRQMRTNLESTGGLAMTEAVVMALGPTLGREAAQAVVKSAVRQAREQGLPFTQTVLMHDDVRSRLEAHELERALEPLGYLGSAERLIDQVLRRAVSYRDA